MAVVCAKCGAGMSDGAQFCPACGAAVAAPAVSSSGFTPVNIPSQPVAAPAQQPPPAAAGSPPMAGYTQVSAGVPPSGGYAPPAPPPAGYGAPAPAQTGGGSAVKIILIVLAVVIGLGVLGASAVGFMVWRVAHAIHTHAKNGDFTLNTPGGMISTGTPNSYTAEELGADIYPGAQATAGGMRMSLPSGSIVSGAFETSDSKDQVLNFYKGKFGSDASVFDGSNSAMISVKKGDHESVMVTIAAEHNGKTKVSIVHTKNKG